MSANKVYCYPRLSKFDLIYFRLLGPGLGNLLFPWARAVKFSKETGAKLIPPTWPQLKIGPILRREFDSRSYFGCFGNEPKSISTAEKIYRILFSRRVIEGGAAAGIEDGSVVEFSGMKNMFSDLVGENVYIFHKLMEITNEKHKSCVNHDFKDTISVHVRLGDFAQSNDNSHLLNGGSNTRIPIEWYIEVVKEILLANSNIRKIYVFSDGKDSELAGLLSLKNCERLSFGSAIGDLLGLSRSNILVASASTFSMWASFLGEMPTIWFPGQLKQNLHSKNNNSVFFEIEASESGCISNEFKDLISSL